MQICGNEEMSAFVSLMISAVSRGGGKLLGRQEAPGPPGLFSSTSKANMRLSAPVPCK